ncbi:MAG TPA: hypothetical protein VFD43_09610 [Planctomycetota bacterium]|nr:hypothetical protein [Planctomycetota bacterium]
MKQLGCWGDGDADDGGAFWTSRAPSELVESSWLAELERGMAGVVSSR